MRWLHAVRARLRLLAPQAAEARMDDEIRFHIEMETERIVREEQVSPREARRRALVTFGGVQEHRESLRDGRGTAWLGGLRLDLTLGFRMLVKYPGLTVIGGLAMAFGIWFGAVTFQMFGAISSTSLPLPDGERIVRIQSWDRKTSTAEDRVLYDYQQWRTLRSVTDLGAYRDAGVNLVGADGVPQPEVAAEVTASAFRIAPERPLFGRVLTAADEAAGAPPVVLLGHDIWARRFDRDPGIVGRAVKLGDTFATVVGVMPEGFAFPVAHEVWLPLRLSGSGAEPRQGIAIKVFGRLAEGVSLETGQAELRSVGNRLAAEHPVTHAQIQPYLTPYTQLAVGNDDLGPMMKLSYVFVVVLMVVVCSTVALLLFARAASRESELLVRSALGASRRRIVTQLFAEALVLVGVATVAGLALAQVALTRLGRPYIETNYGTLPFWIDFNLSPKTIASVIVLALIGAAVAGLLPARRITRGLGTRLRAGTSGGGGVGFSGVWTAVIVTQVALTVALPAVVMLVRGESKRVEAFDAGFPTQQYLGVTIGTDGTGDDTVAPAAQAAVNRRIAMALEALRGRLEAEPEVAGVTFVDAFPGEGRTYRLVEVVSEPETARRWVARASIDPSYFEVLRAPVLLGRPFTSADLSSDSRVVIVDQSFVDLVMAGRNPVGQRVRLHTSAAAADSSSAPAPWYEIVGVARDLGMSSVASPQREAGLYLPAAPGSSGSSRLVVHTRGDPLAIAPRVRELAAAVDATLRVEQVIRLDQVATDLLWMLTLWTRIIIGLTAVALLLSLSGIYAVLAYIVARRMREIGVRLALGASARRVITATFRRPLIQVSLGVIAGSVLIFVASIGVGNTTQFRGTGVGGLLTPGEIALLILYAVFMLGVCALACVVPTIRALRLQPTDALRAE